MSTEESGIQIPAEQVQPEPAPEQQATAPVEADVVETPEASEEAPKTFTQEELDALFAKRLARAERQWKREAVQQPQPEIPPTVNSDGEPLSAAEIIAQYESEKQAVAIQKAFAESEEEAREEYSDYDRVARNERFLETIPNAASWAIASSDIGPKILYHLGANPKEADRVFSLPDFLQAKEIGKIEANLAANPPAKKTSSAPAPITPVTPRANGNSTYETTDPRSINQMSTSEWIAAERQRQIKKQEANR